MPNAPAATACDLAGMLRGRTNRDTARFVQPGDGALRFQIKMLLAADTQLAREAVRAGGQRRFGVPARQPQRTGVETAGGDGFVDGEDRRQRPVVHPHARCPAPRSLQRLRQHPRDRLLVVHHLGGKQRLVMARDARLVFARHIRGGEGGGHAGFGERRRGVERGDRGMGVRREYRPGVQQPGEAAGQVVRVERFAGDVAARAFVGNGLARDVHAAASACCSHQNFSSRLCASASR